MDEKLLATIRSVPEGLSMKAAQIKEWLAEDAENRLYLYGAGGFLPSVVETMALYGVKVTAILDTFHSGAYSDIPVVRYGDFLAGKPDPEHCRFIISSPAYNAEIGALLRQSFPAEQINSPPDTFECWLAATDKLAMRDYCTYLEQNWDGLSRFSDALADELSRETLELVLRGRVTGDTDCYAKCCQPDQYYPKDILRFTEQEVMVELGANDGMTLREFAAHCPRYRRAYCFEPEKALQKKLRAVQEEEKSRGNDVRIIPRAAWDSETELVFYRDLHNATGGSVSLGSQGQESYTVKTAAVDSVVDEPITFLKMDVEGAEMRALRGAQRQIVENKPKLAVCVYHKADDFLTIWSYLHALVPEYRFYLRHHSLVFCETVLYAIVD